MPSRIRASVVDLARDMNEGSGVQAIALEHYPSMTEKALTKLVDEVNACWTLLDVTVIHYVGRLLPGTPSRWWPWPAAIVANFCRLQIHHGRAESPCTVLEKEETSNGERWVDARVSDDDAAARWSDS